MRKITLVTLSAIYLLFGSLSSAQTIPKSDKLTSAARDLLASSASDESRQYWLYLDSSVADPSALHLSEKSLARRAKVDPVNFLIDWHDYPIADSILTALKNSGLNIRRASRWYKAVAVEADFSGVAKATALPFVRRIDPVKTLIRYADKDIIEAKVSVPQMQTADFDYGVSEFQNRFINAIVLHKAGLTGRGVTMAFFDSGFDPNHPAFDSTSIIATYDFINDDVAVDERECPNTISRDQTFHGTATLSLVGAYVPDTLIGVAHGADFVLAKTEITCDGIEIKMEEYNWLAAAEWADSIGVDIINSSLGYTQFTDSGSYTLDDLDGNTSLITNAGDLAASKNILVVTSAGNDRNTTWGRISMPADGDSILAVGAVNADSSLASFSSPGPTADGRIKPDITTFGVGIWIASHLGGYTTSSGTSFSSPLTAGGAALAMERDPALTANQLLERIKRTGNRADFPDNDFGYGLFDAAQAGYPVIEFDLPLAIQIQQDETRLFDITATGWEGTPPALSAVDLPDWAIFIDNGDGTATLELSPDSESEPWVEYSLVASTSEYSNSYTYELFVVGKSENEVTAGPNPFDDEVWIWVKPSAGEVKTIAFYNSSGEIVWEKVNNVALSADEITVLQEPWDGRNQQGKVVAAGVYVLVVVTDRQTYHVKVLKTN